MLMVILKTLDAIWININDLSAEVENVMQNIIALYRLSQ